MKHIIFFLLAVVFISFTSCKQELNLGAETTTLRPGETININLGNETAGYVWTTDDDFVATVSAGIITANHVGRTFVTATDGEVSKTCTVNVIDKVALFNEPFLDWSMPITSFVDEYGMPTSYSESKDTLFYDKGDYLNTYIFINNGLNSARISQQLVQGEFESETDFSKRYNDFMSDVETWLYGRYLHQEEYFLNATSKIVLQQSKDNKVIIEYVQL